MSDVMEDLPAVAGRLDRSYADFERACLVHIGEEQRRPNPDNALIALLCDAVRLKREASSRAPSSRYADLLGLVEQWRALATKRLELTNPGPVSAGIWHAYETCADELAGLLREIGREQDAPGQTEDGR